MKHRAKVYFYALLLLALAVLSWIVIKPYVSAVLFAVVMAYLISPLHKKISLTFKPTGSALLFTLLFLFIIVFLIQYGVMFIIKEFSNISLVIGKINTSSISNYLSPETAKIVTDALARIIESVSDSMINFLSKIPHHLLNILIFLICLFYFLKDGERIYNVLHKAVPLPATKRKVLIDEINRYINAYIRVQLLIGVIQGVVAVVGFYIFGLPYALIAGFAAAILSILPVIGPYALYLPVGVVVILMGNTAGGIGIMIYGLAIGSFLDYGVRPQLCSKYAKLHPLIVIVGIIGGLFALGPIGIFVGPIILSALYVIVKGLDIEKFLMKQGIE